MSWKYFTLDEFTCKCGCGLNVMDPAMIDILDAAREEVGVPFVIESGTRCATHNLAVGGAPHSAHLVGPDGKSHAADVRCFNDILRAKIHESLRSRGIVRFEVSNKHIHADNAAYLPKPVLASVFFKEA
jgi:zinc D-Ala-D-Ala carboxypeptidase